MKSFPLLGGLLFCAAAFAGPCAPGTLQDYIDLGETGCELNRALFSNFFLGELQFSATEINPSLVQVTPGGPPSFPTLLLTLNTSAAAGELFESSFGFNVAGVGLIGAGISLGSPQVTGDGAVVGILDVCVGGFFLGVEPVGCDGVAETLIAFATDSDSQLSSSTTFLSSSFLNVLAGITIDGGLNGSAALTSAAVGAVVPEPSTLLLTAAALGGLGLIQSRRRRRG